MSRHPFPVAADDRSRARIIGSLISLSPHLLDEIAHFFEVYKALEPDKGTEVSNWQGRAEAEQAIMEAQARYPPG